MVLSRELSHRTEKTYNRLAAGMVDVKIRTEYLPKKVRNINVSAILPYLSSSVQKLKLSHLSMC
jgi:hypothetical protein